MRTIAALALALTALPVAAQANADLAVRTVETPAPQVVDPALIGEWTLLKVEDAGAIGRFGGEVEEMTCDFEADGSAEVHLAVMQDQDLQEHVKTFQFATEGGTIVPDGSQPVRYEVLGGDLLVLHDPMGLVVQLVRVDA